MNRNERWTIASVLLVIAILSSVDIYNDIYEGVSGWHISIESVVVLIALVATFYLIRGQFRLQHSLMLQQQFSNDLQIEARKWKQVSNNYIDGLSVEINNQLDHWRLTEAEKEVSFLLLKGLSNKEIAGIRNTGVQTVRTQTNAIYTKSGLLRRSGLSAFFLEDLLLPRYKKASKT